MIKNRDEKMIEILIAALIGVGIGAGGSFLLSKNKDKDPIIVNPHEGTDEAIKNLTNLDITQPLCSPEYIEKNGVILCREIVCLQFSRGLDSKTAGAQCEAISNIHNKIEIQKWCDQYTDEIRRKDCVDLFWKRN